MNVSQFKITLSDVITAVCKRPRLYTLNGTFGEVLAYLNGYANGAMLGVRGRSASYFHNFSVWLRDNLKMQEDDSWETFRSSYPDDTHALQDFSRLWHQFRKAHPPESDKAR